jgi:hypothetical protein
MQTFIYQNFTYICSRSNFFLNNFPYWMFMKKYSVSGYYKFIPEDF